MLTLHPHYTLTNDKLPYQIGFEPVELEKQDFAKEWVLVVDDETFVSQPIIGMLQHLGFNADSTDSGENALKALNEKTYTILLTDIRMPGMNGLELLQKTHDAFPEIITIVMTGFYMDYSWVDVVNSGAADFINKPFGIDELEAKLKRVISERNLKIELEKLSINDTLTGLFNEKQFFATLKDEVIRAERQQNSLALIFIEIDNISDDEKFSDDEAREKLIQEIGGILFTRTRQGVDTCYRIQEDRFAVIAIDSNVDITELIEKRIATAIKDTCQIDVTTGHAIFMHRLSPEELITDAEQNLKAAKASKG